MSALDLFNEFATDEVSEEQGVWEPYADGVEFLIARANNKSYNKVMSRLYEKNRRLLDTKGEAAEKKSEEIMIEVLAKHVLVGWKGEFNWRGTPAGPYSVDKAKELLAVKDFRRWVQSKAEDLDRFKVAKKEEDQGE